LLFVYEIDPSQFGAASRVVALDKPQHVHGRRQLEIETMAELHLQYNSVNNERMTTLLS